MSKKNLTPEEIRRAMKDYLQALKLAKGEIVMGQTDLFYKKGFFHLRPAGCGEEIPAIPYRLKQLEAMTLDLGKQIPQRNDSDAEEYPE